VEIKFEIKTIGELEEFVNYLKRISGRLPELMVGPFDGLVDTGAAAEPVIPPAPATPPPAPAVTVPVIPTLAVTVPAPPVAVIPTPPPAPTATGIQLDSEGLPWDQRIHAGSKTFRQSDNTWKLLKGVDKGLVEQVKAELRSAMGAVVAAPVPPVAVIPTPPPAPVVPAVTAPTPPPAPVATAAMTFPEMLEIVKQHMADGTIAMTEVSEICKKHGFAAFPLIGSRPDMIPTVLADMEAVWQSRQPMLG